MMNNTIVIDENSIYKSVYDGVRDISNWGYEKEVTNREICSYLDGIFAVSERLLKEVDKKVVSKKFLEKIGEKMEK